MFGKKKCKKCSEKISSSYDFCPYCGHNFKNNEDFGMLGKNDKVENEFENFSKSFLGGMNEKVLNKMLGSAMKMLEKEMQKEMKNKNPQTKSNFQLFINGKRVNPENLQPQNIPKKKVPEEKFDSKNFSKENIKLFSKLPKKEPVTKIRRLSNKIIYEIEMPEVKSVKDVSIIQLENSIEIKAVGKKHAYFKIIPINFPLANYDFSKNKLVLELATKD